MSWLQSLDLSILRFVRETLHNSFFDWLMPVLSGNNLFLPAGVIAAIWLAWRGGSRGRLCVLMLAVVVAVGDGVICANLKELIGRPRPGPLLSADGVLPLEQTSSLSMPSSHAANMFSAAIVIFLYYRRSLWLTLPLAFAVGYSRIYKGAHYPTDVLGGAAIGMFYGFTIPLLLDAVWQQAARKWWPLWWRELPSLIFVRRSAALPRERVRTSEVLVSQEAGGGAAEKPQLQEGMQRTSPSGSAVLEETHTDGTNSETKPASAGLKGLSLGDQHWMRAGYAVIGILLVARLIYLASGRIQLGIDEAYQWLWSKHLALSYFSKPPMIAYAQRLGTMVFGDNAFGVRFLSPVSAALLSWLLLRFLARQGFVRAGFWLVLVSAATPLLALGATVLTVDCLLVLFWTAAMVAGWKAVRVDSTGAWLWAGLWTGLGCLSKYTALLQPVCWIIFFLLCKPARRHLSRSGPYLALAVAGLCTLPIWIWNVQHGWITVTHVATNAKVDRPWQPSISYLLEFLGSELALLNPVFFVAAVWAGISLWRKPLLTDAGGEEAQRELKIYFFTMGAPLFLGYLLFTMHSRVMPNWIAAAVLPLFCLTAVHWEARYRVRATAVKGWLATGMCLGLTAVLLLHETNLVAKIIKRPLPADKDPLRQVRAWPETAHLVAQARAKLQTEGRPVFIICAHYGLTGELSFYLPEAKAGVPDHPLVYFLSSDVPVNQFFFWPGYETRKGQNAIYVLETNTPQPPPARLQKEFASVADAGMREILYRGRVFRHLQLFECRDLR